MSAGIFNVLLREHIVTLFQHLRQMSTSGELGSSYGKLKDFDWSVRLVLSSNKVAGLRKPLLQLKLDRELPNGQIDENLLELDEEEVDKLLASLKEAKAALKG